MLKNYLRIAWRNLVRHKGFTIINMLGLTIGLCGCLVIGLFVWDELQYDKSIPNAENIYRIYEERENKNVITYGASVPPAYATYLENNYPEVDTTLRIIMTGDRFLMEAGEKSNYEEKGWFTEPSIFNLFSLKLAKGDASTALTEPASIVINQDIASRYFGNADPIGKALYIDKDTFTVKGVLAKLPDHFHLDFNYLMPLSETGVSPERMELWTWHQFYTYLRLKPGADAKKLEEKFQAHAQKVVQANTQASQSSFLPYIQQLRNIHLQSAEFTYDRAIRGNASYVKALTIIALFVLGIACFNFVNLATARSFRRAKEIGVRKVIGADRRQLVLQFIGETILLSVISVFIATVTTLLIVPYLNQFTGKSIVFNPITNPALALLILAAGVFIGIVAGIYPAFVLSGFQPIKVLKNIRIAGGTSHVPLLRQALVVVQFTLSALLIVSAIIVYKQTNYLNNKDLGFNKHHVIYFQLRDGATQNIEAFKAELKRSPNVASVTSGYGLPGDQFAGDRILVPGAEGESEHFVNLFIGDYDYLETLGLRLIAGRNFSRDLKTDVEEAFIINETAVRELGFGSIEKALGHPLNWNEWEPRDTTQPVKKGKVIGVVQDWHYKSLHEKVVASVIQLYPQVTFKAAVKLRTANLQQTIGFVTEVWNKFNPGYPLDYKFMDETFGKMYENEEKLASLLFIFTIMAIFVGCMGLFGLAAFSAEQRTREIGIRKVLGASVISIMALLSKHFVKLVLIASLIAFPIAWFAMNNWLQDFPYRIAISWWIFAIAIIVALAIALLTVSFQSIRAATANPVNSLRSE